MAATNVSSLTASIKSLLASKPPASSGSAPSNAMGSVGNFVLQAMMKAPQASPSQGTGGDTTG